MRKFSFRRLTSLGLMLLLGVFAFFFLTNDFGLIDIQKTAIVVGVGVDRNNEGFRITAQLTVPLKSDQGQQISAVEVSGDGATVGDALTAISATTGWYPKLTFCELIVLGEQLAESDVYAALEYFLRNENVSDNALVAVCEGDAERFLSERTPTNDINTLATKKVLSQEAKLAGITAPVSLREFSADYFGEASSGYLPFIRTLEQASESQPPQSEGGQGGVDGSQSKSLFDASATALFYRGKQVGLMRSEETQVFCMLTNKIRMASYPTECSGISYTLGLRRVKPSMQVKKENDRFRFTVSLEAYAIMLDSNVSQTIREIASSEKVDADILSAAEQSLTDHLRALIALSRETKCDFFGVRESIAKKYPREAELLGDDFLHDALFSVRVEIKNLF